MKKRIIAVILCVVMITSCLQSLKNIRVCADEVTTNFVEIQHNLVKTNAFSLAKDSKTKLTAVTDIASPTYRWQIMMPKYGNIWVDIMNENEAELEVSYALCSNALLNESAYLRVVASNESNELYSTAVVVTFTDYELSDTIEVEGGEMTELYSEGVDLLITPEPTPEITPEPTPEVTPEITPEPTLEPTPEITPDVTPEPTPEITPDVTPEPTPEITPDATPEPTPEITPDATPEPTPEITPDATPEPTPEITPDVTPEPTPEITPDATPEPTPEITPDATPEPTPEITPDATPEPTPEITPKPNGEGGNGSQSTGSSETFAGRILRSTTPDPDPSGEEDYVYVTVEYLNEEGNKLFQPFTAQLHPGSELKYDVYCPSYVGYAPYKATGKVGDKYTTESTAIPYISFNQIVNSDITITIIYKPQKVAYGVRFMFQKTNSDEYEEDAGASFTGYEYTGVTLTDDELLGNHIDKAKLLGFKALYHYPDSVAADGSTLVYYYFDRIYNLIKFDLDGGFGMEPQYGRYGSNFIVNTPTKPGYIFDGWELILDADILKDFSQDTNGYYYKDDEHGNRVYYNGPNGYSTLPSTVPAIPLAFKAKWTTTNTTIKVVYWLENANDTEFSVLTQQTVNNVQSASYVNGSDYKTLPNNSATSDFIGHITYATSDSHVLVEGDGSTIVNVYYTRNRYTLRVVVPGETCRVESHVHTAECYKQILDVPDEVSIASMPTGNHDSGCYYHHTYSCFPGATNTNVDNNSQYSTGRPNGSDKTEGYIYSRKVTTALIFTEYYRSIWINGHWYEYSNSASTGTIINPQCGYGSGELQCNNPAHYLSSYYDQYNNEITSACNVITCGKAEHSHNGTCNAGLVYACTAKYGQDVTDVFPIDGYEKNRWTLSGTNSVIFNLFNMPGANEVYVYNKPSGTEHDATINYYLQKLSGGSNYDLYQQYTTLYTLFKNGDYAYEIEGFSISDDDIETKSYGIWVYQVDLYYKRNSYPLTLSDGFSTILSKSLKFEDLVENAVSGGISNYIPPYPSASLEENAYVFGGWYTTAECVPGTEYDPTMTMPARELVITAKWIPLSHTVNFFKTYDQMKEYEESLGTTNPKTNLIYHTETVPHGNVVGTVTEPQDDWSGTDNYHFANWFFEFLGETKAYLPAEMTVNRDMNVYADWGSDAAQPYVVHYVLDDPVNATTKAAIEAACGAPEYGHTYFYNSKKYYYDGTDYYEKVADDTTGYAFEGTNRTFQAKTGLSSATANDNELYDGYGTGYFPTLASHALQIKAETNNDYPVRNSYMFTYAHVTGNISYKVCYVDKNNLSHDMLTPKTGSSGYTTIEERFAVVTDYVPDAFYKKLILSVVKDSGGNWVSSPDNVLYFLYSKGANASMYSIHFMLQDIGGNADDKNTTGAGGYTESEVRVEGSGDINKDIYFAPLEFEGFEVYDSAKAIEGYGSTAATRSLLSSGDHKGEYQLNVKSTGSDLYIYYKRKSYDYYVYYLLANTPSTPDYLANELILNPSQVVKSAGSGVVYFEKGNALFDSTVSFTCDDSTITGYAMVSDNAKKSITIHQDIDGVCQNVIVYFFAPEQYLVQYMTAGKGGKVSNGNVTGTLDFVTKESNSVTATADEGYYFAGWYMDADCTVPVTVVTGSDTNPATGNGTETEDGWEQVADMASITNTNYTTTGLTDAVKSSTITPTGNGLLKNSTITIFYAKFMPLRSSLRIERTNAADSTQPFVYRIQSKNNDSLDMYVTIIGNEALTINDILIGEYVVTEITDWSFRYDATTNPQKTVQVIMGSINGAKFDASVNNQSWLTDTDYTKNSKR